MKNQNNDTYSLAQGKYPWGISKKTVKWQIRKKTKDK